MHNTSRVKLETIVLTFKILGMSDVNKRYVNPFKLIYDRKKYKTEKLSRDGIAGLLAKSSNLCLHIREKDAIKEGANIYIWTVNTITIFG